MPRIAWVLLVIAATFFLTRNDSRASGQSAVSASQPARPAPEPLTLTLCTDKTEYQIGESVTFTRTATNQTKENATMFPFKYMNGNTRFYWTDVDTLQTKRFGDGKDGVVKPMAVAAATSVTETLTDNILTARQGHFFVFTSARLPNGTSIQSNILIIRVVAR